MGTERFIFAIMNHSYLYGPIDDSLSNARGDKLWTKRMRGHDAISTERNKILLKTKQMHAENFYKNTEAYTP